MKSVFPGYFSGTAQDVDRMWAECIFVLDANVLLNLYRYSNFTRNKLLEVFDRLAERLWIPNQVAKEYFNNRLKVIGQQGKVYDDAVKSLQALKDSLESHNQHPFVSEGVLKESLVVFEKLKAEFVSNKREHEKRISDDEIKDGLGELLAGKVGDAFDRARLEQVLIDGKSRYEQKIPPGFCDTKKKTESTVFEDMCRPFGDYIIWLQIIEKAQSVGKPVVFVTGDSKEDWWASFQGKTIGPQPKLVEEFTASVGLGFYMYSPDRFLERASKYLEQDAPEQAVNEIRDIQVEDVEVALRGRERDFTNTPDGMLTMRNEKAYSDQFFRDFNLHHLMGELSALSDGEAQMQKRLDLALVEREKLAARQEAMVSSGVVDGGVETVIDEIIALDKKIHSLEASLSMLRMRMRTIVSQKEDLAAKQSFWRP